MSTKEIRPEVPLRTNYLAQRHPRYSHTEWVARWRRHWRLAESLPESGTVRRYLQCEVLHDRDTPAHDGLASAEYFLVGAWNHNRSSREYHRIMQHDELLVFGALVRSFSFVAEHHVLTGAGVGPFKVVRYLKRRPGVEDAAFVERWTGRRVHALEGSADAAVGHAQNRPIPTPVGWWGMDVAGSEEIWFDLFDDARRWAESDAVSRLDATHGDVLWVTHSVVTDEVALKSERA